MKSMQCLFYDLKFKYPNALQKCTEQGRDRQTTPSKEAYSFSTRTGKPILLSKPTCVQRGAGAGGKMAERQTEQNVVGRH